MASITGQSLLDNNDSYNYLATFSNGLNIICLNAFIAYCVSSDDVRLVTSP